MKSMTGYGKAQGNTSLGVVTVEVTTVNHRNLDIRLRLPDSCRFLEIALRAEIKSVLRRGHVEGMVRIVQNEAQASRNIHLNQPVARAYHAEATRFCSAIGLTAPTDISWILAKPEVWQPSEPPENKVIESAVVPVFAEALRKLRQSREMEGAKLCQFFEQKLKEIEPLLQQIQSLSPLLPRIAKTSLVKRLEELSLDPSLNPDRLAQEVTYLAQRSDITEELSRFSAHLAAFREKIRAESVSGRELDFTLQEMNREINTMGSKGISYDLSSRVIQLKEMLNQMREQVQNVE